MLNYSLSHEARQDIDDILIFIAADNIDGAVAFNDRLEDIFSMIGENSKVGRERPELSEGLRSFPSGNYLVFYRIWAGEVVIARVLHCVRDLDALFS